jgi:hypothetical protein
MPSKRYITLLRDGAKHWDLSPKYQLFLNEHPCAAPGFAAHAFALYCLLPLVIPMLLLMALSKMVKPLKPLARGGFHMTGRVAWGCYDGKPQWIVVPAAAVGGFVKVTGSEAALTVAGVWLTLVLALTWYSRR